MKPAPTPLAPGFVLGGRVRLVRPIAAGGMGEVWVAINEATGAEIAAKIWRAAGEITATRERFTHEAQLGAKLAHRNVVRIFDLIAEDDGTLVLLMELLRGETIEQRIASKGPMPAREAIATILPILSGLQHAHEMGVVHRDVKPANIFLAVDPDGTTTPKLLDFGIAKIPAAGNHTVDGHVLGTPRYMSPEHIRGKTDLDGRSDLFSVAAVLFEMLTGRPPFGGATPGATLAAVLELEIDPDPSIDPRLWMELSRALAKRPYERHRSAREFASALCAAVGATEGELAAEIPKVKPPQLGAAMDPSTDLASEVPSRANERQTVRTRRRQRAMWIVVAACAAAIGVALAVSNVRRVDDTTSRPASSATPSATIPTSTAPSIATNVPSIMTAAPTAPADTPIASPPPRPTPTAPARPRVAPPAGPRPVATTPGF